MHFRVLQFLSLTQLATTLQVMTYSSDSQRI